MTVAILQLLLSSIAALGVFVLWRRVAAASRPIFWLVTAGVLIRAVGGQLAFWISFLGLPIARSLQVRRGLWIFAIDAIGYFDAAAGAARGGAHTIIFLDRTIGSVFYVQALATALMAFGAVTSVAILLNVAAYLGTCAMALLLARGPNNPMLVFSIAVLSLSPSAIMWALQPLKDTVFLFLVAACFAGCYVWQQRVTSKKTSQQMAAAVLWTIGVAALVYAISGIRWYFGLMILMASLPFVILTVIRAERRLFATAIAAVLVPLLGASFFAGAGPYVPPPIYRAVFGGDVHRTAAIPKTLLATVNDSRAAFDKSAGATMIGAGDAIKKIDDMLGAEETVVDASRPPDSVYRNARPGSITVGMNAPPAWRAADRKAKPGEPVERSSSTGAVAVPASSVARLVAGTAALVLPRSIGQRLGLFKVGGGRGLWLFVEVDTIVFDAVLLFSLVAIVLAGRRGGLREPVFWMMLIVTGAMAAALAYTVSNFGTLFRHRDMVLIGLTLLPLAAFTVTEPLVTDATWRPKEAEPLRA